MLAVAHYIGPSSHLTFHGIVLQQSWFLGDRNWYAAYLCLEDDRFRASAFHPTTKQYEIDARIVWKRQIHRTTTN